MKMYIVLPVYGGTPDKPQVFDSKREALCHVGVLDSFRSDNDAVYFWEVNLDLGKVSELDRTWEVKE